MSAIRLATAQDMPHLPAIEMAACELFAHCAVTADLPAHWMPLEAFREAQQHGLLWVAVTAQDAPIGFALVERFGATAHLAELDVLPDYGRRGIGTGLVRAVCEWAVAQRLEAVTLTTFRDVPWNAPFYQRLGFRVLPPAEWTPLLCARVAEETAHGLPAALRVVMQYDLQQALPDKLKANYAE